MGLRIYVTGWVAVEVDGRVVIDERQFRGKQGRLLFVYLVSERSRPVAKEELASVLWPDEQSESWEAALSALTSRLAALLSSDELESQGLSFSRQFDQYQIRLSSDAWSTLKLGIPHWTERRLLYGRAMREMHLGLPPWRLRSRGVRSCRE